MTDEEIIKQIQGGDKDKYGEIIDRYQKRIAGFVRKMIGRQDEIEDLVENTLISAYENIQSFNLKQKFDNWILRIAHNKTVDFIKKKKPTYLAEEWEDIKSDEMMIEEMEIKKENKYRILKALDKLELKYREVLILYYFEEKSYEEISDILKTTVGNVGIMIKRAKEKLKKLYE